MQPLNQNPIKKSPAENKCRLLRKKRTDGTEILEIQGKCSKDELIALREFSHGGSDDSDYEDI